MGSIAARAVAQEVLETIGSGKKPSFRKIARKHGYAPTSADNPKHIVETKSYQEVMKPLVDRLNEQRDKAIERMEATINKAQYHQAVDAVDKLTKNIQLLTGKSTENIATRIEVTFRD